MGPQRACMHTCMHAARLHSQASASVFTSRRWSKQYCRRRTACGAGSTRSSKRCGRGCRDVLAATLFCFADLGGQPLDDLGFKNPCEARRGELRRALGLVLRMTKTSRGSGACDGAGDPLRLCLAALARRQPPPVATGASEHGACEPVFLDRSRSAPAAGGRARAAGIN
jgi:hypothetical protein